MTKPMKLNDLQLVLLWAAAQRSPIS